MESVRGIVTTVKTDAETGRVFAFARYESGGKLSLGKFGSYGRGIRPGDAFVCDGDWRPTIFRGAPDTIFDGRQLRPDIPRSRSGAEAYLLAIFEERKHGVTKASVAAFLDREGPQILKAAVDRPDLLLPLSLKPKECKDALQAEWSLRTKGCLAVFLLEQSGVDMKTIDRIVGRWRDETYEVLKRNPYAAGSVGGVGFGMADKVGRRLGISQGDPRRLAGAVNEVLRIQADNGSTAADIPTLLEGLGDIEGVGRGQILAFLESSQGGSGQEFTIRKTVDGPVCAPNHFFQAEASVANGLMGLLKTGRANSTAAVNAAAKTIFAAESFAKFDDIQRTAVRMAATEPVSIVTGGPGTGKSTVMEAVARMADCLDKGPLYLIAPTGKAAKRLHATTNRKTSTIHRLLGARNKKDGTPTTFRMNASNRLPAGAVVVVDETSMLDVEVMAALMAAMPDDGRIVLVGDKDQLPSVGAGSVLADMLSARIGGKSVIPFVSLSNVYRTSKDSLIAVGARTIREGGVPEMGSIETGGISLKETNTSRIVDEIVHLVCDVLPSRGLDPLRDVAVLCPQAPDTAGTWEINRRIQARLNSSGADIPGVRHGVDEDKRQPLPRVGDRVMLTENDADNDVMNGDIGFLASTRKDETGRHVMKIKYDCGAEVEYPTSKWRSFPLAYAGTIHKSQGSQFKAVIMPMASTHQHMLDRTLVYTGWTRATDFVFLVGERECFVNGIANTRSTHRNTLLEGFLSGWSPSALNRGGRPDWSDLASAAQREFDALNPLLSVGIRNGGSNDNRLVPRPLLSPFSKPPAIGGGPAVVKPIQGGYAVKATFQPPPRFGAIPEPAASVPPLVEPIIERAPRPFSGTFGSGISRPDLSSPRVEETLSPVVINKSPFSRPPMITETAEADVVVPVPLLMPAAPVPMAVPWSSTRPFGIFHPVPAAMDRKAANDFDAPTPVRP